MAEFPASLPIELRPLWRRTDHIHNGSLTLFARWLAEREGPLPEGAEPLTRQVYTPLAMRRERQRAKEQGHVDAA